MPAKRRLWAASKSVPSRKHFEKNVDEVLEFESFKYNKLDRITDEIRLLRLNPRGVPLKLVKSGRKDNISASHASISETNDIHLEIFNVKLDDYVPYKALSYTWGNPKDPHYTIYLNGRPSRVRENLWEALVQFRQSGKPLTFWIDAICIDQDNATERSHQVSSMKKIYEQAEEVLVWLGPYFDDCDLAFQFVHELYDARHTNTRIMDRFLKSGTIRALKALAGLLYCDYWDRIWIVQELTVARKITLLCGSHSVDGHQVLVIQQLLKDMRDSNHSVGDLLFKSLPENNKARSILLWNGPINIHKWKNSLASTNPSFFMSLLHHCYKKCSDPRDIMYGLAARANDKSTYKVAVDYSLPVDKVYTNFARLEISASNRLDVLTCVCASLEYRGLPSWVPNWAFRPWGHHFLKSSNKSQPNFLASAEADAVISFETREDVLTFEGLSIGSLELIGTSTGMESEYDIESLPPAFLRWWLIFNQMKGDQESNHEAFIRTLLCEKDFDLLDGSSRYIRWILGAYGDLFVEKRSDVPPDTILMEYWNSYLAYQRLEASQEDLNIQECRYTQRTWTNPRRFWNRRFFTSGNKLMGLAPIEARKGDIICIPLGCWHPLILRKIDEYYINLDEAYVDGYMHGKAIDMWKAGELELQKFEIH